jgi:hypothetical protein
LQKPASSSPAPSAKLLAASLELGPDGFLTAKSRHKVIADANLEANATFKKELLIYNNPSQSTWLLTVEVNLYVLLDDINTRSSSTCIQTFFNKSKALPLKFSMDLETGLVEFAAEEGVWYYSTDLFPTPNNLETAITRLLK